MANSVQIFSVGGGGFTDPKKKYRQDALMEDYLLALAGPTSKTRIGYIGHANNDDPIRIDAFHKRFQACAITKTLPRSANLPTARHFMKNLDILYVGGGATAAMLAHWQKTGIAGALITAANNGLILSGVSAGAICWFSELLLGTAKEGYALHKGLGLLAGSACPHFSNEPSRKCAFKQHIGIGHLADGIAIDNGVAVHICDGVITNIIKARKGTANAYFIRKDENRTDIHPLEIGYKLK